MQSNVKETQRHRERDRDGGMHCRITFDFINELLLQSNYTHSFKSACNSNKNALFVTVYNIQSRYNRNGLHFLVHINIFS